MATAHRCGWVALMGPPNAGKSTLTNALVGQKVAIVTRGQLGKIMVQSAWQSFAVANCIVLVIDGDLYLRKPDFMERDLAPLIQPLAEEERPVVVVVNKVDLFHDKSRMLPLLESVAQMFPKAEIFPASALRRNGVEQLLELIRSHLPEGEAQFPEDQLSTAPMKFMAAEIIREKLFEKLYQEVPYSVAVDVEVWDEEDDRVLIHAAIYVAKPSHKAMVIGRAGEGIKAIGTAARKEIRDLVDKKVHLELWVKVREDWVDDPQFLHSLGFGAEAEY